MLTPGWSFLRAFGAEPYGRGGPTFPATINVSGLLRGAAVVYDVGNGVTAPSGPLARGFAGLIHEGVPAPNTPGPGSTAGTDVTLRRSRIGHGLLCAGQSVVRGQALVIAAADGSLRAFRDRFDSDCELVGTSEQTLVAGSSAVLLLVNLDAFARIA